jgi:hypothetical protein
VLLHKPFSGWLTDWLTQWQFHTTAFVSARVSPETTRGYYGDQKQKSKITINKQKQETSPSNPN